MRIHPAKQVQFIFHRGTKVQQQRRDKLVEVESGLLIWKEIDWAVATFKNKANIQKCKSDITKIIDAWNSATS